MHEKRKTDHISINLKEDVSFNTITTGLEKYRFIHSALPELDLTDVITTVTLFGKRLNSPILIASMTGGTEQAAMINRNLAQAAEACQIAMGVGSQRVAIENPSLAYTFNVRPHAPTTLIFANLGAVQLNYGYGLDHCQRVVDMIEADALILHFNPLQEAVQPKGDTNFADLYQKIEHVCRALPVAVIAKEVGWGFSKETAQRLIDCGISAIDVAGSGGTTWSQVEMYRASTKVQHDVAAAFHDWGIPTAEAILNVRQSSPHVPIIASGGLRSGIDIAKCIALGATIGSMANPFLKAAMQSTESVVEIIDTIQQTLRIAMFATGIGTITDLQNTPCLRHVG
ncbi:MAG: type 2 isopentenyl-diphosphate Delta-isomerase [Anaerolineaceae bacterium 4572_78]|nr:MAG: type 2 isopentenyl-diphosphate Delta-isomerase [Anaerolineaceae bacterium 4572_78]